MFQQLKKIYQDVIYCECDGLSSKRGLIDPYKGQFDLKAKVIRCVGNPDRRFNEDALRMLRAYRFVQN